MQHDLRQTQSGLNSTRRAQRGRRGAAAGFIHLPRTLMPRIGLGFATCRRDKAGA